MKGWFEVFRAGKYPQGDVTAAEVEAIARQYDPAWREAPVVLGHPEDDQPAMGWVEAVQAKAGTLFVKFKNLVPEFVQAVKDGRFGKVSVRLLQTERGRYLGHVGFLGAALPAVAGLAPIRFEALGDGVEAEMDFTAAARGGEGDMPKTAEERAAELEERLKAAETKLSEQQMQFTAQILGERRDRQLAEVRADLTGRVKDGKLAPSLLPGLAEFVVALPAAADQVLEFTVAEGKTEKKTPRALFLSFLDRLPEVVSFGEVAGRDNDPGAAARSADFANLDLGKVPVDAESAELHRKALDFQEKHAGVDYASAVKAVLAGKR